MGNTTSEATTGGKPDFPIFNAFQSTNPDTNSNSAGYVTVVNGGGGSLMYSSFLGGTGTPTGGESLTRIAVDSHWQGVRHRSELFIGLSKEKRFSIQQQRLHHRRSERGGFRY